MAKRIVLVKKEKTYNIPLLVNTMQQRFFGRKNPIVFQNKDGSYRKANMSHRKAFYKHILHKETMGLYLIDEMNRVQTMCIDIDNHGNNISDHEFEQQIKIIIRWLIDRGIAGDQILIEDSGGGYHIWFYAKNPITSEIAVEFLSAIKRQFDFIEIFPPTSNPPKYGNVIRIPLGVHQKRFAANDPKAKSNLCYFDGEEIIRIKTMIKKHSELKSWAPLSIHDIERFIKENKGNTLKIGGDMFVTASFIPSDIKILADKEPRSCIRMAMTHRTSIGSRNFVAFMLGLFLKYGLWLTNEQTKKCMRSWREHLIVHEPEDFSENDLNKSVKRAIDYKNRKPPNCKYDKTMGKICAHYGLKGSCEYAKRLEGNPVNKVLYRSIKEDKSWRGKLIFALFRFAQDLADNNGEFRVLSAVFSEKAGMQKATLLRKMPEGMYAGKTKLEVLEEAGIASFEVNNGSGYISIKMKPDAQEKAMVFLSLSGNYQ